MITLTRNESPLQTDFSSMSRAEFDARWREVKSAFDQALTIKIETDRLYQAKANELNTLERLLKKMEKRAASTQREAARMLRREA